MSKADLIDLRRVSTPQDDQLIAAQCAQSSLVCLQCAHFICVSAGLSWSDETPFCTVLSTR